MSRFVPLLALRLVLAAGIVLAMLGLSVGPVEAKDVGVKQAASGKEPVSTDLIGSASNLAGEAAIVFITNTNTKDAVRALVTAHDSTGALVGCALRMLKSGEDDWVYIADARSTNVNMAPGPVSVRVYGLTALGSLMGKLDPVDGLVGTIAQVEGTSGATRAVLDMFQVATAPVDRQEGIDECFGTGTTNSLGGGKSVSNPVTTNQPARWSSSASSDSSKSNKR